MKKKSAEEVLTENEDMTVEEFKRLNPEYVARLEKKWEDEDRAFFEKLPEGLNGSERMAYVVQMTKKECEDEESAV